MIRRTLILSLSLAAGWWAAAAQADGGDAKGVDLLERYPTGLTGPAMEPAEARTWAFGAQDVYGLTGFSIRVGENLRVEGGPADLGIGHCEDDAVWAVVLPKTEARLTGLASPQPGAVDHVWLRFHPSRIADLFPPGTVRQTGEAGQLPRMQRIAEAKFHGSWHAGDRALIPKPQSLTVDLDTTDGVRRFFVVDWQTQTVRYLPVFEEQTIGVTQERTAPALTGSETQVTDKPAAPPKPPASAATQPPKVVEVSPKDGAEEVDPITDLRIRFDQPMDPAKLSLRWDEGFYKPREPWRYEPETHEFVIPVQFKPFEAQRITVNPTVVGLIPHGFQSVKGVAAERFDWAFKTKRDFDNEEAPVPQMIEIDPPAGSIIGRITPVRITFDQPMDPDHLHGIGRQLDGDEYTGQPYFHVRYVEDSNQFVIPLSLPAGWSGELVFEGFRSEGHRHADPVRVIYTTTTEAFSEKHLQDLEIAGRSPRLQQILGKVAQTRGEIKSISERVRATRHAMSETGIYTTMLAGDAVFRMDGLQKFYGNVTGMMNAPFIVGSTGEICWCFSETESGQQLVTVPFDQVATKNVLICDPFHSTRAKMETAIKEMRLEYLGTDILDNRPCHVIQGWWAKAEGDNLSARVTRWWIDGLRSLPIQVVRDWGWSVRVVQRFTFESINEPLPELFFVPPMGDQVRSVPPEPLDAHYDSRFLDVIDPAIGQLSVRWGRQGPAGTTATGLR